MTRTLITHCSIVTMDPARPFVDNGGVVINANSIERVLTADECASITPFDGTVVDASGLVMTPGFVQTHVHLCQTIFRGLADDLELLDWLRLRIFPFEAAHDAQSMYASAMIGIAELVRSGTTTILDMGSVHHEEEVVRALTESGLRAFVGKAMMDINTVYPKLKETTRESVNSTLRQAELWHDSAGGRIRYAVAPRFVLSCSDELLREAYAMTRSFPGMLFHTHAAENRHEMAAVRERCKMDNVEFFDAMDILHHNTCLAHCIWLNPRELDLLKEREAKVSHCPSSNFKLGSGVARVPELLARGITVSIGADGAPCNNTLDMFHEMRLAALMQKPVHGPSSLTAGEVFAMATSGGAKALGLADEIGSIQIGMKADLVLLNLGQAWNPYGTVTPDNVYSTIVYTGSRDNVHSVMVDGEWLFRGGLYARLEAERLVHSAGRELQQLLERIE